MTDDPLDRLLDELDRRLLEDPTIDAALFERMLETERANGLMHGDRPICPFLRYCILSRSRFDAVSRAAELLGDAFERISRRALEDDAMLSYLGVTHREAALARVDPGYTPLCASSRLDTFLSDDGFNFLEYNAESPAGLGDQMVLDEIFESIEPVMQFLDAHDVWRPAPHARLLDAIVDDYREWGGEVERPLIAIVDWRGVPTTPEFHILSRYFESQGYPTVVVDPHDIRDDGTRLTVDDRPIDIFYKRVIIHELLAEFDDDYPVFRAYRDGRIFMANSFRVKLVHKKASFAILTDPRYASLFSDEQRAVIAAHVPWTRNVAEGPTELDGVEREMRDLLATSRDTLVLKPNDDYGGHDVVVGASATPEEWMAAIERAFDVPTVVQRRVPMRRVMLPMFEDGKVARPKMTIDFDPFLFNGRVHGGLVRLSSSALSNVSSGGHETALAVFEGA